MFPENGKNVLAQSYRYGFDFRTENTVSTERACCPHTRQRTYTKHLFAV